MLSVNSSTATLKVAPPASNNLCTEDYFGMIFANVELVHHLLAELEEKLAPITVAEDNMGACSPTMSPETPLYRQLQTVVERTDGIANRVKELIARTRL
jgi:hypothetical protein